MNTVVWIVQAVLAGVYVLAGFAKLSMPFEKLKAQERMAWVEDVGQPGVRLIGLVELLGAIGLIVPALVSWLPSVLVPLAAVGLALVQVVAFGLHVRRNEPSSFPTNVALFLVAAFVALGRFSFAPLAA